MLIQLTRAVLGLFHASEWEVEKWQKTNNVVQKTAKKSTFLCVKTTFFAPIASFCEDYGLTFPIAADEAAEIYYRYATMYVPRCYVIDNQGIIRLMVCEYSEGDINKLMNALTDIQHP